MSTNELAVVMKDHGIEDVRFGRFMVEVDQHILRIVGLRSIDIEDYSYADCFEAGDSPVEVARQALNYSGWSA
jgi:hypothetical protein